MKKECFEPAPKPIKPEPPEDCIGCKYLETIEYLTYPPSYKYECSKNSSCLKK